jgi:outer membrane protein assembly factor BamB
VRLPDPQRSRAVLIGTGKYADKKLPDLPVVGRTIGDLAAALTDPVCGIVAESHCAVLEDQGDIRLIGRHLRSAARDAEDLLLVYFVGHGLVSGRRHELYLGLPDSEWAEPEFNSLEYDKLRSFVLDSAAATKIIILDCCFSGRVVSEVMADPVTEMVGQIEVDGTYVLASAERDQVALILPGENYTAFTGRFLHLLRNGVPGGPELLTVDYLYRQLVARMRAAGLSQPQRRATATADLLALAVNQAFAKAEAQEAARRKAEEQARGEAERQARDLANHYALARAAEDAQDWDQALTAFTVIADIQPDYRDVQQRADNARKQQLIARLRTEAHSLHQAGQWAAVVRVGERLQGLDPVTADPDGLVTSARAELAAAEEAERQAREEAEERVRRQDQEASRQKSDEQAQRKAEEAASRDDAETVSQHDEDLTSTVQEPRPGPGGETTRTPGHRPAGRGISSRTILVATGAAVAVIGLVIAIIMVVGQGPTGPTPHVRWTYPTGSWVESRPAVADGTVYIGSGDDKVYALNAATGRVLWSYTTGFEVNSSPAVADGTVYIGSDDDKVYALNAATGRVLWTYTTGGNVDSSPTVTGSTVYIGGLDDKVYALNAATGQVLWTYTTGGQVYSSPAVAGGTVYIDSVGTVYALNAATGHVLWINTTGSLDSSPAVAGGTVYIGSGDDKVYALNAATGQVLWTYTTGGNIDSSPAVAGGTVYIGSDDNKVYALNAATGQVLWTYTTGGNIDSSPAVAGGTVYIGSDDNKVYALSTGL